MVSASFGGIVRCDRVANGVVQAYKNIGEISVPIVVRLQGTNSEEGAKIIKESGLEVFSHSDRVVLFMENRPDYIISILALNKIGAIGVLINTPFQ